MKETCVENCFVSPQKEYTFPNLIPTSECKQIIQTINSKTKPHKIVFWITFAAFLLFMILTASLAFTEFDKEMWAGTSLSSLKEYTADYTGGIICAVLCGVSVIIGIVNIILSTKYNKCLNYANGSVKINSQYSAFINQGFNEKEAYKLTLEWIDRQTNTDAINNAASASAMLAMTNIANINRH